MMAAAEARVAWQRTANRYFVQEDAKRAPKLACCPPSSEQQVDVGPTDVTSELEHASIGYVPLNWNPSNHNLPHDTKWWLQLQPNFGHQKDFTSEQLNLLEVELESLRNEEIKRMSNKNEDLLASEEGIPHTSVEKKAVSSLNMHQRVPATCMKIDSETIARELTAANCKDTEKKFSHKNLKEYWYKDELMDIDPVDHLISKQPEKLFDMESPWMKGEKSAPWWRTADKDELASLVAQKSLDHVENCDLPPPHTVHARASPFSCAKSFDQDRIFPSSTGKEPSGFCSSADHTWGCLTCGCEYGKQGKPCEKGLSNGFDKSFSANYSSTYTKDPANARNTSEIEPSKAQLMEALRHSQTRAREAENAAQKAFDEKEHIIKLFFRQASHLFAYKQWLQVLQLESICLQLKNKDQSISTLFPMFLPWMPCKDRKSKNGKQKTKKTEHSQPRYGFGRSAFAFAVGLGLAGAGLLLGWTMGWLFPCSR